MTNPKVPVVVYVDVKAISPKHALDPEDEGLHGRYLIRVEQSVPIQKRASAALDVFHAHVAIEVLDDFEISVRSEDERLLRQDESHENYSLEGAGEFGGLVGSIFNEVNEKDVAEVVRLMDANRLEKVCEGAGVHLNRRERELVLTMLANRMVEEMRFPLQIDGTVRAGGDELAPDGTFAPFFVFDPNLQINVAGPFDDRDVALAYLEADRLAHDNGKAESESPGGPNG